MECYRHDYYCKRVFASRVKVVQIERIKRMEKQKKRTGLLVNTSHFQMSRKFVVSFWKDWLNLGCLELIHHNGVGDLLGTWKCVSLITAYGLVVCWQSMVWVKLDYFVHFHIYRLLFHISTSSLTLIHIFHMFIFTYLALV